MQARQTAICPAIAALERQQERLLTAYVGDIVELPEFERKRRELQQKMASLHAQRQLVEALVQQHRDLQQIAASMERFCSQARTGLEVATFEQRRLLIELLVDQVVLTNEDVEIRYVMPTSPNGARQPFCQLRLDYRRGLSARLPNGHRCAQRTRSLFPLLQPRAAAPSVGVSDASAGLQSVRVSERVATKHLRTAHRSAQRKQREELGLP